MCWSENFLEKETGAINYAIRELRGILETEDLYQHSILINKQNKKAIYTGLCNRSSKPTVHNKKIKDRDDTSKGGVHVRTAEKAVLGFFNKTDYADFSINTKRHEGCVFVRKIKEKYHIVY